MEPVSSRSAASEVDWRLFKHHRISREGVAFSFLFCISNIMPCGDQESYGVYGVYRRWPVSSGHSGHLNKIKMTRKHVGWF